MDPTTTISMPPIGGEAMSNWLVYGVILFWFAVLLAGVAISKFWFHND